MLCVQIHSIDNELGMGCVNLCHHHSTIIVVCFLRLITIVFSLDSESTAGVEPPSRGNTFFLFASLIRIYSSFLDIPIADTGRSSGRGARSFPTVGKSGSSFAAGA